MRKIFILTICIIISFYSFSFAINEFNYESAKTIANTYIRNSSLDENWKDKNPYINGNGKYFYTDGNSPSYIEFKVSCDNNVDCGFIMVNYDGDDVAIPVSSTNGNTPSEILSANNESLKISDNKLYYFSPFEQYAENELNGNISSIDPLENDYKKNNIKNIQRNNFDSSFKNNNYLKDKLNKAKTDAKNFKNSNEFKNLKKELKENNQTNGKEDKISFKYLDMAMAGYNEPTNSNVFVKRSTGDYACSSDVPCYNQFKTNYQSESCYVGCIPTAIGIVYGYYDLLGNGENLISGADNVYNNNNVDSMIKQIGNDMGGKCDPRGGQMTKSLSFGIKYAKDRGYSNSTIESKSGKSNILFVYYIIPEIDKNRPVVLTTDNHAFVAYGYNKSQQTIRVNLGRGYESKIIGDNGKIYFTDSIDYNINSIFYKDNTHTLKNALLINIKK